MLLRLVFRPDRAMALAALGLAAGILLPVTGSLVVAGLVAQPEGDWIAYPQDPAQGLGPLPAGAAWVLARSDANASLVAFRVGDPIVKPGARLAMPDAAIPAGAATPPRATRLPDGVAPDAVLVHPGDLGPAHDMAAGFARDPGAIAGAVVAQERGADAFEAATTAGLREQSILLVAISIPAVTLVGVAFARQEARARRRQSTTLVALGGARMAWLLVAGRAAATAAGGALIATAAGAALYQWGPAMFHPDDAPRRLLALAIAVPAAAAAVGGALAASLAIRRVEGLRTATGGEDDVRLPVPAPLRPLLLGLRPLPVFALAALLFLADVGFPVAAAAVPGSFSGGRDEWIFGADDGVVAGSGVPATVARVARFDPAVAAVLAETLAPTLLAGEPVLVRGGDWDALAAYHGLRLVAGDVPGAGDVVLGAGLAHRLDAHPGDLLAAQAAHRADAVALRVAGIADGPSLFRDEAFVPEPLGRRLAGVPEGQASVLHVRPDTDAALRAVQRVAALVVVPDVRLDPPQPVAGSVAHAVIEVANLGREAGSRALTLRVNGEAVAEREARLQGHSNATLRVAFVVPPGPIELEVNPAVQARSTPQAWRWEAGDAALGTPFPARLLGADGPRAGVAVGLYRDADGAAADRPVANGTTDAQGTVGLVAPSVGDWLLGVRPRPGTEAVFVALRALAPGPALRVAAVWVEPALPPVGSTSQVHVQVENLGARDGNLTLTAAVDGLVFATQQVSVAAASDSVFTVPLYIIRPAQRIQVGDVVLELGSRGAGTGAGPPAVRDPLEDPAKVGVVQARLADRALGDARAVLLGLAGSAGATMLALLGLTTRRTLAGRRHVADLLVTLGWDRARIAQRAALEGAVLGAAAALAAAVPAKLLFIAAGRWGPAVFAHGLPDPVSPLFAAQAVAAYAGVCALAAYFAANAQAPSGRA